MLAYDILRYTVFAVFVLSGAVAVGSWAVRTRRINPFGRTGQFLRKTTDPVLAPIETALLRRGGNPQNAGWWLLSVTIVVGVILIAGAQWLVTQVFQAAGAVSAGPRGIVWLVVYYSTQLILFALIVRVIGSWVGVGRYNRWMKPAYWLTDWIVVPLRRVIPPFGMFDVTPLIAWFLILLLRGWILRLI